MSAVLNPEEKTFVLSTPGWSFGLILMQAHTRTYCVRLSQDTISLLALRAGGRPVSELGLHRVDFP